MMKSVFAICTAALLLPTTVFAAGAPPQLHNKTISVSFSASVNGLAADGTTSNLPRAVQRTIYISSQGRVFSRSNRQAGRNFDTVDRDPSSTAGSYSFSGTQLVGVNTGFISGAGRMVISFDSGFQSCTASIAFGREGGKPFTFKGLNGKTYTSTSSPTASTPSCSIREGNPF